MKLTALVGKLGFLLLLSSVFTFATDIPIEYTLAGTIALSCFIPATVNTLAMNGLVARENFSLANTIFNNAFNPKTIIDKTLGSPTYGKRIPNAAYIDGWDAAVQFRLCQSTLVMEQPILQGGGPVGQFLFPILNNIQNQGVQFNTETRLNSQDTFVPTEVGIFLCNPSSAVDATFKPITWASPFTFANAAAMQVIYNGNLQLQVNNVNYINKWDLWRHWVTNQTQQTAAFGAGSPVDQMNGADDGFYPMQPFVMIVGTSNIQLTIGLPLPPTAADAFSRIRVVFRGVLAQNSTVTN